MVFLFVLFLMWKENVWKNLKINKKSLAIVSIKCYYSWAVVIKDTVKKKRV